jgi:tetratricopeptide (TPR) repeat protein
MCGSCEYAIPAASLKTLRDEILNEVARISHSGTLSPQERTLLRLIVERTLDGNTGLLYQKQLADDLGIPNAKQVGVVATRIRTKLTEYYDRLSGDSLLQIALSDRGYEAFFTYRQAAVPLSEPAQAAVANAKAALDQRTLPGIAAAIKHLQAAILLEPDHPLLLALTALSHATRAMYGTYPLSDLRKAEAIVRRMPAAPGGGRPWESWFAEACVSMALHWDWPAAEASFDRAIALSGGAARRLPWYTAFLASQGRAEEAVPLLRTAVSQNYDSPIVRADLASNQILAGHYADAQETIQTAFALFGDRTHYLLHVHKAILHEAMGDSAAAAAVIERVPLKWPQTTITLGLRALFSGLAGDRKTARRHFRKLRGARLLAGHYIPAGQLCIAALGAGDHDGAVEWLREGAVVERDPNLVLTNVYPFFRHLRENGAFQALVQDTMRLKFPPAPAAQA